MKKLLIVLAIGTFAACNSATSETSSDSTTVSTDTSVVTPDTTMMAAPDTTAVDSAAVDTTKH